MHSSNRNCFCNIKNILQI